MGLEGRPADPVMAQLLARRGIDLSGHRSRGVSPELARKATSIVVMERRHRAWFRENLPEALPKITLLREAIDGRKDLPDPVGEALAQYEKCLDILERALENLTVALSYPS